MSFFELDFENHFYIFILLFLSLLLFLLVLHKYFRIFDIIDAKKVEPITTTPTITEVIEENDADIDSESEDGSFSSDDPLDVTLRAAQLYIEKGEIEKAATLYSTIEIPAGENKIVEINEENKITELSEVEIEPEITSPNYIEMDTKPKRPKIPSNFELEPVELSTLFKFDAPKRLSVEKPTLSTLTSTEKIPIENQMQQRIEKLKQNEKKSWTTSAPLNAYIQIIIKNIKDAPENSENIINDARKVIQEHFSNYTLPDIFLNVM